MDSKDDIRRRLLKLRLNYSDSDRIKNSTIIINSFYDRFKEYKNFLLYSAIKGEVDLSQLLDMLVTSRKNVYLPVVDGENISFHLYDKRLGLTRGEFGIDIPNGITEELISSSIEDTVIAVPGIAFGYDYNRIGYGLGFYDKFLLERKRSMISVGLSFNFQLLDIVPEDLKDEKLDMIISEIKII